MLLLNFCHVNFRFLIASQFYIINSFHKKIPLILKIFLVRKDTILYCNDSNKERYEICQHSPKIICILTTALFNNILVKYQFQVNIDCLNWLQLSIKTIRITFLYSAILNKRWIKIVILYINEKTLVFIQLLCSFFVKWIKLTW